ncbi:hypothetical protein [Pseudobacteriovorax antillogorgiicola]|uniref:Uncharacterized protein n=1 Tax=Pseudobacteriovorax antillogorgiicola TaxID=1513793 RepID=A0A1Y6CPH3_9BACT|nr:hypothetical protein [Pseudobacteriovorax antillogorgiicola]TCS42836.1 hypothetical protein EDD56_1392 [Pseudobacteriovorax antillogorgiicola]SMF81771.1 hypothetical protein SAMN06296036_1381 [Pseudobacteriovorax antillogorgiicola]
MRAYAWLFSGALLISAQAYSICDTEVVAYDDYGFYSDSTATELNLKEFTPASWFRSGWMTITIKDPKPESEYTFILSSAKGRAIDLPYDNIEERWYESHVHLSLKTPWGSRIPDGSIITVLEDCEVIGDLVID